MSEAALRIRKLLQDWKNNPTYWKNNKRKFRGYPVLRKKAKKSWHQYPQRLEIFYALSDYLDEAIREYFNEEVMRQMAKIDEIRFTKYGKPGRDNI